jgi:hypothetical protein
MMDKESCIEPAMATPSTYQITVKGLLSEHWADWFNGALIRLENNPEGKPHTTLTCKVRDQSELLGILNRLNSLNLPLLQVIFINKG